MKQHQYEVTLKHVADADGNPSTYREILQFNTANHDDIFKVLARLQQAELFDEHTTQSFAVGLKLFGEVMLENKKHPLFAEFFPQFVQFMQKMKGSIKAQALANASTQASATESLTSRSHATAMATQQNESLNNTAQ